MDVLCNHKESVSVSQLVGLSSRSLLAAIDCKELFSTILCWLSAQALPKGKNLGS